MTQRVSSSSKAEYQPPADAPRGKRKHSEDLSPLDARSDAQRAKLPDPTTSSAKEIPFFANQLAYEEFMLGQKGSSQTQTDPEPKPREAPPPPADPRYEYAEDYYARMDAQAAGDQRASSTLLAEAKKLVGTYQGWDLRGYDPETLSRIGKDFSQLGLYQAIGFKDPALQAELDFRLAQAYGDQRKFGEAIELLEKQIKDNPRSQYILYIKQLAIFLRLRRNMLGDAILAKYAIDDFALHCPVPFTRGQVMKDAAMAFLTIGEFDFCLAYLLKAKEERLGSDWEKKMGDLYEKTVQDVDILRLEKELQKESSEIDYKAKAQVKLLRAIWKRNGPGDRVHAKQLLEEVYAMPIQDASYKEKLRKTLEKVKQVAPK
jgi:tetratricopeptide (TPR) repeat protein